MRSLAQGFRGEQKERISNIDAFFEKKNWGVSIQVVVGDMELCSLGVIASTFKTSSGASHGYGWREGEGANFLEVSDLGECLWVVYFPGVYRTQFDNTDVSGVI